MSFIKPILFVGGAFLTLAAVGAIKNASAQSSYVADFPTVAENDEIAAKIAASERPDTSVGIFGVAGESNSVRCKCAGEIAKREWGLAPRKGGGVGEIGLFQLRCDTAKMLGFSGKCKELYDPQKNSYWGTLHLRRALDETGDNWCRAATLHNRGLAAKKVRSHYCEEVLARL